MYPLEKPGTFPLVANFWKVFDLIDQGFLLVAMFSVVWDEMRLASRRDQSDDDRQRSLLWILKFQSFIIFKQSFSGQRNAQIFNFRPILDQFEKRFVHIRVVLLLSLLYR